MKIFRISSIMGILDEPVKITERNDTDASKNPKTEQRDGTRPPSSTKIKLSSRPSQQRLPPLLSQSVYNQLLKRSNHV